MKTRKVLDICFNGTHIVCIHTQNTVNPFRVYRITDGHRKQIAKYADFKSVLWFVPQITF